MEVDQKIIDLACKPISESAPCGINAKYETSFERLEAEISKSESLSAESTDWAEVLKLSEEILGAISKDFTVACYLSYAYIREDGYKGLLQGLTLLSKLSDTFWEDMFPPKKRLRGRQNSAQWLIEKIADFLNQKEPSSDDMVLISGIAKTLKNLDYDLAEKMDDKAPNFSDISRPIKRLKEIAASQEKEKPVPSAPPPSTSTNKSDEGSIKAPIQASQEPSSSIVNNEAKSAPSEPEIINPADTQLKVEPITPTPSKLNSTDIKVTDVASDNDAKKTYKQIQDGLRKLANYYGQAKQNDPRRFRLSRSALWDGLDKLPPVTDNKSHLPAPAPDKIKKVKDLYDSGDFLEAINLAEKSAEKMPYWFEGNRYIAMSLDALGTEYSKAKTALEVEIVKFTSRLPKILDIQYANGVAFADDQTKSWINSLSSSSDNAPSSSSQDNIHEAFLAAKKLSLSGKLAEGFSILNACPANTKRDRFKIKMACAELACLNGQEKVGIPMLERLVEETRTLTAAEWESDFLAKALALLVNAYEKLNDEKSLEKQKQIDAAYDQLCWYNPALLTE